jgi:hypothetical protein
LGAILVPVSSVSTCARLGLAACASLVILAALAVPCLADASRTAHEFLKSVQKGDVAAAKGFLESRKFRSAPLAGGDDAYFVYESAHEPNLAFLVGHPFDLGKATVTEARSDWYVIDGTLYATVSIPLYFTAGRYRPFVLPPHIALGRAMPFAQFMDFVAAPERYPDEFTLRVRPSIEPGLIRPPSSGVRMAPPPPGPPGAQPMAPVPMIGSDSAWGTLGRPAPRDPSPVLLPSGGALSQDQLRTLLPRLGAITLELHLVRRGRLASWGLSWFHFSDAIVVTEGGEVRVQLR